MVKYFVKNSLNKKKKKSQSPISSKLFAFFLISFEFLSEKRECGDAQVNFSQQLVSSIISCSLQHTYQTRFSSRPLVSRTMWSKSRVTQSRHRVTLESKGVDNKSEEQPWPQLMCCASIFCRMYGCIFQEDRIVTRSSGEEWYIDKSKDRACKRCYRC